MSSSTFTTPDTSPALSLIAITVYAILILPAFYVWQRHGRPGFLAYNFIYVFCAIRIAGSSLSIAAIHDASLQTAAAIVSSIAISPMLLATLGVLHEARTARIAGLNVKREWRGVWCLHSVVTTGMVLVIVGIIKVVEGGSSTAESALIKAGMGLLVVPYVVLLLWTVVSLRQPFLARNETLLEGTILLRATLFALPFIAMRIVYGFMSLLLTEPGYGRSWMVKVTFCLMPEIVATAMYVIAGYRTRNMYVPKHREILSKA